MKRERLQRKNINNPKIKAYTKAIEKGLKSQHVIPKDSKWAVKKSGAQKATQVFDNKKEAVKFAKKNAQKTASEVFVHAKNGRIQQRVKAD